MMDHAWDWAQEHGQLRVNAIHGEEEARLVIEDFFGHVTQQGSEFRQSGSFTLEARGLFILISPGRMHQAH